MEIEGVSWPLERRSPDCYDWITREEVTRMAVLAFETARLAAVPPPGEKWFDPDAPGCPYSDRRTFAITLATVFEAYVKGNAYMLGIGVGEFEHEHVRLSRWCKDSGLPHGVSGVCPRR